MFLDTINKLKESQLNELKQPKTDVYGIFKNKKFGIIAEIKKASPSKGNIYPDADVVKIAGEYIKNGAAVLSVLTEQNYFNGSIDDIKAVRKHYPNAVILRKDFIIDDYQIYETKYIGADMILIILGLCGQERTLKLISTAKSIGLEVLLEVHDENEMKQALQMETNFIGVNNRNLQTLKISLDTSKKLSKYINQDKIFVCESGLNSSSEIAQMYKSGYKGFLIGSHFMESKNQGKTLKSFLSELENEL